MKFSELVIASSNANKILELKTVARDFGLTLFSPKEIQSKLGLEAMPEVEETGETYFDNALLKAQACANWSGLPSIGDDSGLEISALDWRPGLYSARYGGVGLSSEQRYLKLLDELENKLSESGSTDRAARFRCVLVLKCPGSELISSEGILEGNVLSAPRGELGFGYDPIIEIDVLGKTLAEVDFSVTCSQGFRAIAARKLFSLIA